MSAVVAWFREQGHRAYLYRVAGVIGVVLGGAGVVTDGQAQTTLLLLGTLLGLGGNGLATANTTTKKEN